MFTWKNFMQHVLLASMLCVGVTNSCALIHAEDELKIGSQAPALDVEHWVHDGNGKFKPVTEFSKSKVYVVEFWATWCGPCIASMPHLVAMQQKFADKDVQIVSISNEDLATVDKFLDREYKVAATKEGEESGDTPKTYRELTSAYCLTTDPDGSSNKTYMEAAGQNGIPCAFIVGKDQKIEWIGHPMSMDKVLEEVVEGKWNREAFAEEFNERQKMSLLMAKISRSARSGKMDEALAMIEEVIASADTDSMKQRMQMMRVQLLAQNGKSDQAMTELDEMINATKEEAGKQQLKMLKQQLKMMQVQLLMQDPTNPKLADGVTQAFADFKDNPQLINMIAWNLYEKFAAGSLEDKAILKASREAAENAAAAADDVSKAAILDTAAHLQFLDGDTASAIKTQEDAVKLAGPELKDELTKFLEELKAAK